LFTGDAIAADEAQAIGLIHQRAPEALLAARHLAARIAANAPQAVRGLKRGLNAEPGGDARFDAAFAGPELREGLAAFHSRRPPEFP
ncbi:enoyl-CoA hydratase, partial [Nostoc sp. 3335mG]